MITVGLLVQQPWVSRQHADYSLPCRPTCHVHEITDSAVFKRQLTVNMSYFVELSRFSLDVAMILSFQFLLFSGVDPGILERGPVRGEAPNRAPKA